ncbi:MAG: PIN domain-containing protein [Thermoleophilia bacterium]|nr:PIN domain-containing protein [Thermoleophilia bacterium]
MRAVLDTSILIGGKQLPAGIEASISAVSISELHFGLLVAPDEDVRAERVARMGLIEARFPNPLPLDDRVARAWAQLQAAVVRRGAQPRTRMADLAIAATAIAHGAVLITANTKDLKVVEDLVQIRTL